MHKKITLKKSNVLYQWRKGMKRKFRSRELQLFGVTQLVGRHHWFVNLKNEPVLELRSGISHGNISGFGDPFGAKSIWIISELEHHVDVRVLQFAPQSQRRRQPNHPQFRRQPHPPRTLRSAQSRHFHFVWWQSVVASSPPHTWTKLDDFHRERERERFEGNLKDIFIREMKIEDYSGQQSRARVTAKII